MVDGVVIASMRESSVGADDSRVADVKFLFDTHVNDGKVVVVVEGFDDKEVYERMFNSEAVCIYPDCNCEKHYVILKALNSRYASRLLAIKDADFDRLEGVSHPYPNLVLTDVHDLEGMIAEDSLSSLEGEDAERCRDISLGEIYDELEDISYLKWLNHKKHYGINFSEVSLDLDMAVYFNACVAATGKVVNVTLKDVYEFKTANPNASEKELSNGHDIFERIYFRAHNAGVSNFPKKPFFRRLRQAYPKEAFLNTDLCHTIQIWALKNGFELLCQIAQ